MTVTRVARPVSTRARGSSRRGQSPRGCAGGQLGPSGASAAQAQLTALYGYGRRHARGPGNVQRRCERTRGRAKV
jgi:hypothetical protein